MVDEYPIRDLQRDDYNRKYIELLSQLTKTGDISKEEFEAQFDKIKRKEDYIIKVIVDPKTDEIVGSGTLIVEYKFIHKCSAVGHIEDIVICEKMRGKNLGRHLVEELIKESKKRGCYKTLLCCREKITTFYEKCGLEVKEVSMAIYHE